MDDVDASHAQAAQHIAESGNLITSQINGIRYIEKPPLPYWIVAGSYRIFGQNTFATHLPNCTCDAGADVACLGVGHPRLGTARRPLCRDLACLLPLGLFSSRASLFPRRSWRCFY
jgi:4-amino-4-deoxy-L-arabinose transferase-like glycosyltransferase